MSSWLEVSLIVDGELAEAVAEVLARYAPNGVVIESTAVTAGPDDSEGHAIGPLRVSAYLPVVANLEEQRRKIDESLWYLGKIRPLPPASYQFVEETNWAEAWKKHYKPIAIGRRLEIVPAWLENPNPERIAIHIDPGMAFGTGTHPTTQLCLEFVEGFYTGNTNIDRYAIDVGCGSGILSIAALKLGAPFALGIDIDREAIKASRENAVLNQVEDRLELAVGSLSDLSKGAFSLQQAGLVLANILAPVLISLLDEGLGECVKTGGWLVLSGILEEQASEVETALSRNNLALVDKKQIGDWVAIAASSENSVKNFH
jgi:ribosomal protein L11 methyltransferase